MTGILRFVLVVSPTPAASMHAPFYLLWSGFSPTRREEREISGDNWNLLCVREDWADGLEATGEPPTPPPSPSKASAPGAGRPSSTTAGGGEGFRTIKKREKNEQRQQQFASEHVGGTTDLRGAVLVLKKQRDTVDFFFFLMKPGHSHSFKNEETSFRGKIHRLRMMRGGQ